MTEKVKIVCARCGSEDVRRDAYAVWSFEAQVWELSAVFDAAVCESDECGGEETSLDEVPAVDPAAADLERLIASIPASYTVKVGDGPKLSDRSEILEAVGGALPPPDGERLCADQVDLTIYFAVNRVGWVRLIRDDDGYAITDHHAAPDDVDGVIRRMVAALRPEVPA